VTELHLEDLGAVEPGSVLVIRSDFNVAGPEAVIALRDNLAARVGHDEFGVVVMGTDGDAVELLRPADLSEVGWIYIGSAGCCPSCGSDDVVVRTDTELVRSCSRCGHRWSRFHPGRAA
jgi:hypothetical protein